MAPAKPNDRSVVVIGASSGIGRACALRLDTLGFRVFAGVRREVDAVALRQRATNRLTPLSIDVTDTESIRSAMAAVERQMDPGQQLALVNGAGIAIPGPLETLPIGELRKVLETNVVGHIAVIQSFLPLLRRHGGRIVSIGSLGGTVAFPFNAPYHASKFALEALSDSLRAELRPWHIPVSLVEPGIVATPIWEKSLAAGETIFSGLPPGATDVYAPYFGGARRLVSCLTLAAVPVDRVADAVVDALSSSRPRARYPIGRRAIIAAALFRHLPAHWRDGLVLWCLSGWSDFRPESKQESTPSHMAERKRG